MAYLLAMGVAMAIEVSEADGNLAPGEVEGGHVELATWLPLAMIGYWGGSLGAPARFGGILCDAGALQVRGGRMTHCTLAESTTRAGVTLPAGTKVEMSQDVRGAFFRALLPHDLVHRGRRYPGGEELVLTAGGDVELRVIRPPHPAPVALPLRWGTPDDRASLHADGSLARGLLASPAVVDGVRLPGLTVVHLDAQGRLMGFDTHAPVEIDGRTLPAGRRVTRSDAGFEDRSLYEPPPDIHHQRWRVTAGLFYGYPFN
ncbi:MAG: hypothetical protein H6736_11350 [Alphaproteobacteria bacterium]|nr:hypothetical protein [Alphaproteobacteria bacterium]